MDVQKIFQMRLERLDSGLGCTVIARIPFDPVAEWPGLIKLRVKGTIQGTSLHADAAQSTRLPFAFCTSLLPSRDPVTQERGYFLLVTQKMQRAAHVSVGWEVEIALEPELDGKSAVPPAELARLLRPERSLKKWFEGLPFSQRKYIADSIRESSNAETRERRAEQWVECLMLTQEGEIEPPPILQLAFREQPRAGAAWETLTPIQRRSHLLAIFSCQSPDSRTRRAQRAVSEALRLAGGKG